MIGRRAQREASRCWRPTPGTTALPFSGELLFAVAKRTSLMAVVATALTVRLAHRRKSQDRERDSETGHVHRPFTTEDGRCVFRDRRGLYEETLQRHRDRCSQTRLPLRGCPVLRAWRDRGSASVAGRTPDAPSGSRPLCSRTG